MAMTKEEVAEVVRAWCNAWHTRNVETLVAMEAQAFGCPVVESYAASEEGGLWLINAYIPEYPGAGPFFQHEPRRRRKLLLHKKEIHKLSLAVERKGMTIVPLELYFNPRGIAKLKLAVAEGKKLHDKREDAKKRDWNREKARLMKQRR